LKLNPELPRQKQHSTKRKLFTKKLNLKSRKKQAKCCIWNAALYGAETWTLRKIGQYTWKILKCGVVEG
jgi:hypothetical protein